MRDRGGRHRPTAEETKWFKRLRELVATMPPDVWLFVEADSGICLMRKDLRKHQRGHAHVLPRDEAVDQDYVMDSIYSPDVNCGAW